MKSWNWLVDSVTACAGNARLQNGERYTGEFKAGVASGRGRTVSPSGERYSGEFADGKRHGFGRCVFENGDKYQGAPPCHLHIPMAISTYPWQDLNCE